MIQAATLGIVGLLLAGLAAPVVVAESDTESPEPRERPSSADARGPRELPAFAKARVALAIHERAERHDFAIRLNASGVDQHNASWQILAEGVGLARAKTDNGTLDGFRGFARLRAELLDENGTVVRQGTIHVRLAAMQNETGDWKWRLVSVGRTPDGTPRLFLHGDRVSVENGTVDLGGSGFAIVKADEDSRPLVLRLRAHIEIRRD